MVRGETNEKAAYKSEMDVDLVKSALTHAARLTNSPARSLKRMVIKVQWLC